MSARIHTFSHTPADQYVIGDIHGCIRTLRALWDTIQPGAQSVIFCLGDYIHKGPHSKAVVDFLIEQQQHCELIPLLGNHDVKLLSYFQGNTEVKEELETLGSGDFLRLSLEEQQPYANWLAKMPHAVILPRTILVHGGLDFARSKPFENPDELMNLRATQYVPEKAGYRTIVHGHIPRTLKHTQEAIANKAFVIPLDNGCVYPEREGMGYLSALHLNSCRLISQKNLDQT